MLLSDKVTVITGAASGLGRAMAFECAREGARIAILDRSVEASAAALEELREVSAAKHFFVEVDVASAESVDRAFDEVLEQARHIDALVNSAGVREITGPLEISAAEWEKVIAVNLSGTFYCARAAARAMAPEAGGSIVNISSVAGLVGFDKRPAYSASKAGVIGITRSLAKDLASRNVRVNAICPGLMRTQLTEGYFTDAQFVERLPITIPLGRPGRPDNIAKAALFLLSDLSEFITGIALPVDGGFMAAGTFDVSGEDSAFNSSANSTSS